ncbi:NYN domain-containing protein [Peristeroidobacter soli]|uniref:NYN domain-containing protein n=1 Tax=Peristeroidobacter soli TaxID=2497877 RepID=UPI00101BD416|nr:NYN domain-containing protein [Peristeroidobacter soli]
MAKVSFYVDGFNLYHAISKLQRPELKWLNLRVLAASFLEKQDTLVGVTYFTAPMVWNADKYQRHREYITALVAQRVAVVESRFLKSKKYCNGFARYCDFYEEKQTDVAFAVRVLTDAHLGVMDRAILVTADSDQIPLVRQLVESFPALAVHIAAPPGRMREARDLCKAASHRSEISEGRLATCLMPRNVTDETGRVVARCPISYLPAK